MSGRLPQLKPEDLNDAQRTLYDALVASFGAWADTSGFQVIAPDRSLLGPLNPLLFSPALGAAQVDVFHADRASTSLPPRVHEVVILTVGAAWDSDYELYAHSATGKLAGLSRRRRRRSTGGSTARLPQRPGSDRLRLHTPTRRRAPSRCRDLRPGPTGIRPQGSGRHGPAHRALPGDLLTDQRIRGSSTRPGRTTRVDQRL
jgi:hypothetical protein